jgi:hypothetical protein
MKRPATMDFARFAPEVSPYFGVGDSRPLPAFGG